MDIVTSRNGARILRGYFALFSLFLYGPILILVGTSFSDDIDFPLSGFTTRWYTQFLSNPALTAALRTSAIIAAISSVITVALGVAASIALVRRKFLAKAAVSALFLSPLVIPYLAFGISLLVLFRFLGIPLGIMTVVIGHTVISLPYTILVLAPRLDRIDVSLEDAARDLGANSLRTFRSITLPLILPAIVSALIIAFTISFDEFAVAFFVVGRDVTFPIYLYSQLRFPQLLPQVIAVSAVVIGASLLLVLAAEVGRRIAERRLVVEVAQSVG